LVRLSTSLVDESHVEWLDTGCHGWRPCGKGVPKFEGIVGHEIDGPQCAVLAHYGLNQEDVLRTFQTIALSQHRLTPIEWLWEERIACGSITLIEGDPGNNKSSLLHDVAARITTGRPMPGFDTGREPATVVVFQSEDSLDTVRQNVEIAGADLDRVVVLDKSADAPMLPDDMGFLASEIESRHARLLVIDPVTSFMTVSINNDQAVRRVTNPLKTLAERTCTAIVLVRHLTKASGTNPLYRGAGSIALTGACRSSLLVAPDPGDPGKRILASIKSSLATKPPSLLFRPVARGDGFAIEFMGSSDFTAGQLLEAGRSQSRPELEEAIFALFSFLGDGRLTAKEVKQRATEAGIAGRTLRRAKDVLGVKSKRRGFGRGSEFLWELPEHNAIVGRLRERDFDHLMNQLCHGEPREGSWPEDTGRAPPDPKKDRKRLDKPTDDESGNAPMPAGG
jgi:hypothetical protein